MRKGVGVVNSIDANFYAIENMDVSSGTYAVEFVDALIMCGISSRASDIHIHPGKSHTQIKLRIDGKLLGGPKISKDRHESIISRLKVISGMNISEKRIPQDGRLVKSVGESEYDLRTATIATVFGEKAVIRILEKDDFRFSINNIGMTPDDVDKISTCISGTGGMVLISGPTGSGKTTTLYSILNFIKRDSKNIITVEDPVEYTIGEVSQIQVNRQIGLDFAEGLRAALRHDPDVIMIGEIRDNETASIAMRAAITGHLVLSTIHTNDSASTVTRLLNMGIPSYIISAALKCVISQRLLRVLCKSCKNICSPMVAEKTAFYMAGYKTEGFCSATGCRRCAGTGYYGRTGVYEVLCIDRELSEAIIQGQPQQKIRDIADRKGMSTMLENAARLVVEGTTSAEEISQLLAGEYL